jgi:PAP2 superfamily
MRLMKKTLLRIEQLEDRRLMSGDVVLHWNELLLQSLASQPPRVPLARNLALVHVAMFDAVNAIDRSYSPYFARVHASRGASQEAAAAQAAHDTLAALYPARQAIFDAALAEDLAGIPRGRARQGIAIGREVARQILTLRSDDGSSAIMSYTPPTDDPGQWQPTPPDFSPAGNVHVPFITPFAVDSTSQFRPGPYPALTSAEYAADVNEVKALGGIDSTARTADQTQVGLVWRLALTNHTVWNRIAQDQAAARGLSLAETARLFALLDISMNDGLQTSNEAKFHYELWRPVTAIQRADEDGNPDTEGDPSWMTLHPTTPPYPAYSSNASTIGASSATVLAGVLGRDDVPFEIHWDAYGFTGVTRSYAGFWAAADEMANSRIYGGIHFRFDCVAGQEIGFNVARYVMDHVLLPRDAGGGAGPGQPSEGAVSAEGVPIYLLDVNQATGGRGVAFYSGLTATATLVNPTIHENRSSEGDSAATGQGIGSEISGRPRDAVSADLAPAIAGDFLAAEVHHVLGDL